MIPPEVRLIAFVVLLIATIFGVLRWRESILKEGEQRVVMADQRAVAEQAEKDTKANAQVVNKYEAELARLRGMALQPVPIRLCVYPRSSGTAIPVAGGTQPPAATGGSVPELPNSIGTGPDIGPQLRQLALRGDELSAQVRALLERENGLAVR